MANGRIKVFDGAVVESVAEADARECLVAAVKAAPGYRAGDQILLTSPLTGGIRAVAVRDGEDVASAAWLPYTKHEEIKAFIDRAVYDAENGNGEEAAGSLLTVCDLIEQGGLSGLAIEAKPLTYLLTKLACQLTK